MQDDEKRQRYLDRKKRNHAAWRERHRDEIRAKRKLKRLESPRMPSVGNWKVIGLCEKGSTRVRWCEPVRIGCEAPWRTVWRHRHEITSSQSDWLLRLDREPTEAVLLSSVSNREAVARLTHAVCELFSADLNQLGRPGRRGRPVAWIKDGQLRFYPSESKLAEAMNVYHPEVVWLRILGLGVFDGSQRL